MKLNTLLVVSAVLAALIGIVCIVSPGLLMGFVGTMGTAITTQVLGANFIGFAVLNFFARNVQDGEAQRSIVLGNLVSNVLGFVLVAYAQLTSSGTGFGWLTLFIYLILILSFGYFLVIAPRRSLARISQ